MPPAKPPWSRGLKGPINISGPPGGGGQTETKGSATQEEISPPAFPGGNLTYFSLIYTGIEGRRKTWAGSAPIIDLGRLIPSLPCETANRNVRTRMRGVGRDGERLPPPPIMTFENVADFLQHNSTSAMNPILLAEARRRSEARGWASLNKMCGQPENREL